MLACGHVLAALPRSLSNLPRPDAGLSAIAAEIEGERAQALGRSGRAVEVSLAALRAAAPADPGRATLVRAAAEAVWGYFVQREACGMTNHDQPIADYAIPGEVLARVGAFG